MRWTLLIILSLLLGSCQEEKVYVPRPHQYPRVTLPEVDYKTFVEADCPFQMEIPNNATITLDHKDDANKSKEPCWFDLSIDDLNATIHWSYYQINRDKKLENLVNDAFTMASKHNVKASFREEFVLQNKNGNSGHIFQINGPVATPYQFYITDSTRHFLRGSLYFDDKVDYDSVAPILTHLQKDIDKMLYTLDWK